jgi:hypothetical protein
VYIASFAKVSIEVVLFLGFSKSNVFSHFHSYLKKNNKSHRAKDISPLSVARAHLSNMTRQEQQQKQQQSEDAGVVSASVQKAAEVIKDKVDQTASKVEEQLSGGGGSEKAGEAGNKGGLRGMMGKLKEKLSLKRKKSSSSSSSSSASLTVATNPTTRPQIPICGSGNKRRQ